MLQDQRALSSARLSSRGRRSHGTLPATCVVRRVGLHPKQAPRYASDEAASFLHVRQAVFT